MPTWVALPRSRRCTIPNGLSHAFPSPILGCLPPIELSWRLSRPSGLQRTDLTPFRACIEPEQPWSTGRTRRGYSRIPAKAHGSPFELSGDTESTVGHLSPWPCFPKPEKYPLPGRRGQVCDGRNDAHSASSGCLNGKTTAASCCSAPVNFMSPANQLQLPRPPDGTLFGNRFATASSAVCPASRQP
jgi:hypothetical protein